MRQVLSFITITLALIFWAAACSLPRVTPTQVPTAPSATVVPSEPTGTPPALSKCEGTATGIVLILPDSGWTCSVELLGEGDFKNEIFHVASPVFSIEISTLGRGPFCQFPGQDESCVQTPFYTNELLELSTWSSYGEIKEIFGSLRAQVNGQPGLINVSVKYTGMETRELTSEEKQQLVQLFDSITFKH